MQGGWWGPWPRTAPHQQRALASHTALWVLEPQPSVPASCRPLSLPSLLVLLPQALQAHSHTKPGQQHHLLCPQPGCRGQEMARHTPASPLGATLTLHTRPAIPHCGCCGDSMPGPDACPPLCPGCPRSWASRSRASALASQAVLPGKSMSSQGSRGPHRQGSPLGAPVVLHSPLGEALTCGGLGAPQASSLDSRNC